MDHEELTLSALRAAVESKRQLATMVGSAADLPSSFVVAHLPFRPYLMVVGTRQTDARLQDVLLTSIILSRAETVVLMIDCWTSPDPEVAPRDAQKEAISVLLIDRYGEGAAGFVLYERRGKHRLSFDEPLIEALPGDENMSFGGVLVDTARAAFGFVGALDSSVWTEEQAAADRKVTAKFLTDHFAVQVSDPDDMALGASFN